MLVGFVNGIFLSLLRLSQLTVFCLVLNTIVLTHKINSHFVGLSEMRIALTPV